jgi:hypothetical protein
VVVKRALGDAGARGDFVDADALDTDPLKQL